MRKFLPYLAALPAILLFTGLSAAQAPATGTTPGTGLAAVDLTKAPLPTTSPTPAPGMALQTPQPAECLCDSAGQDRPWLVFAPYGWLPGMHGTIGVGPLTAPVNVSVSDAFNALDDLKGALMLHVEGGYGEFGVIADLTYIRLAPSGDLLRVDSRSTLFEFLGLYRVLDTGRQPGGVTFDLLAGARYYRFTNQINGNLVGLFTAERTSSWCDLVVGARAGVQVTDDFGVFARGDIGGFGISDSSKQACNVIVGFEYRCSECASLVGGYRWLKIDRDQGVGRDRSLIDATLSGPFVALALRY
jgi:hypothetical protein